MRIRAVVLAAAIVMAPLGARGADLVVWWDKGYYAQEDEALREIIAAFEQETGNKVELRLYPSDELPGAILAALEAGQPPDFAFSIWLPEYVAPWAFEDRLADLSDAVGPFSNLFDPEVLDWVLVRNGRTGQRALSGLPIGRETIHLHVWKSMLEDAGFTLADIPTGWAAFWSFWCEQVQPAVRRAMARNDIWGVGMPMSIEGVDTNETFLTFIAAYEADYIAPNGDLIIDTPTVRQRLIEAVDSYTAVYRKGCTPPASVNWDDSDNNKQFHAKTVVMTPNGTLSIPNAIKHERPDDYYDNITTIEWPLGPSGEPFPIFGQVYPAVIFNGGGNVAAAKEFVRFLVSEGWLMHYLDFSDERMLPPISKLLEQPFWVDPSDPHRMAAVMQISSRPMTPHYAAAAGDWRHDRVRQERVWAKAINRVAADGISPQEAVDEAIARIKQILSE
jgi:multiple sugar transport system substrate-binding protein